MRWLAWLFERREVTRLEALRLLLRPAPGPRLVHGQFTTRGTEAARFNTRRVRRRA